MCIWIEFVIIGYMNNEARPKIEDYGKPKITQKSADTFVSTKNIMRYVDDLEKYIDHLEGLKLLNPPPVIPCDLQTEAFKLANKLALAGHGNEAVKLHRISNILG